MLKWDQHCRSLFAVITAPRCMNSREFRDPHNPYMGGGGGNASKIKETNLSQGGLHSVLPWAGHSLASHRKLRDWSLITGRGGLQNGKIAGPKLFAPPLKTGLTFCMPPFKE